MNFDFTQYLILLLIALLFAKDTLLPPILKKLGLANGNGYQTQIDRLFNHAKIANEEMGDIKRNIATMKTDVDEIKSDVSDLKSNVAFIRGKLDK